MGWMIAWLFEVEFDFLGFHISVNDFVSTVYDLCDWTKIQETDFWEFTSTINQLLIPTALSLLVLFTLMEYVKEAMNIERVTWERMVMIFVKFLIIKFCITNSHFIMTNILQLCQDIFMMALPTLKTSVTTDLGEAMESLVSGNIVEQIMMVIIIILVYIPFLGTIIGILVQVFQRIGKLAIGCMCAPIPIALGMSEEQRNGCKSFFLWIAAVGFEGLIIICCANMYVNGINSIEASGISKMVAIMMANGFFMAMVSLASNLSERFLQAT